jgi:hypothetical protein
MIPVWADERPLQSMERTMVRIPLAACCSLCAVLCSLSPPAHAAEDVRTVLLRKTQAMMDTLGTAQSGVWREALDDRLVFTSEDGEVFSKAQLVDQIKPFPLGVSGKIQVTDFKVVVYGPVAVATWVADEHEDFHGHAIHCQYRSTDTWMKSAAGWKQIAGQVLALRTDPPEMSLGPKQLAEYCGRYELSSGIQYEIRCSNAGLEGQQTGRPARPLRVEAPDVLFIPGQPRYRRVFLRDASGHITAFAERREAWDLVWKRLP